MRSRKAHIFDREVHDWYQEPLWVSMRLFDVEKFEGMVLDPACGGGNIVIAARKHNLKAYGSDIIHRGFRGTVVRNFLNSAPYCNSIVSNPPFNQIREFTEHALRYAEKAALLFPTRRLNAARWLQKIPLQRIWLLTPRPSVPSGKHIKAGGKIGGGTVDFCWLIISRGYVGTPELKWLHRDDDGN